MTKSIVVGFLGMFVALTLTVLGVNSAFYMMRQPSDIAVLAGVFLLLLLALGWVAALLAIARLVSKTLKLLLILGLAVWTTGCSERIQPGHVGIVVNEWGEDRGVDSYPVQTGRIWYNPISTSVLQYPYFMQTDELREAESIVVNDRDGLRISFPLGVGYSLNRDSVPAFYVKFRTEDVGDFTKGFYRNAAQAAFNAEAARLTAEQIYGSEKQKFIESARAALNEQMKAYGVVTEQFSIIGDMKLPEQVVAAVNAKIQATQKAQQAENELRETKANAEKTVAEAEGAARAQMIRAEADAKANSLVAASLTPSLLQLRLITRWDGKQPTTLAGAGTSLLLTPGSR